MTLVVFWFIVFIKQLLFWLWLWQLKEYHLGRFFAHFEAQKVRKIISSLWRPKYPKFTKKIIIIFFFSLGLEIFFLFYFPIFWAIILTVFFIPLFILSFQIPTIIWRSIIIHKAKTKRKKFKDLLVISITGSYGKTSTKEFLAMILLEKYKVLKTLEHQNSEVGISQCILDDLKPEHQIFVVEMGAYNRGGIKLLCDIVKPVKIGILTGINEQHMATFGSQENIIKTKYELIENLLSNGIAFFNGKNRYCRELYNKTGIKKFLYGEKARVFGEENLLAAIAVAKELGMTDEEIAKAVEKIENKLPGIQQKKGISGLIIFDATYSANPDGVLAHLEYLKTFPGRKIIVMPCLIELGPASKDVHKRIGEKIGEVCDLAIITTKDRFKEIKDYNSPTTRGAQQNWKGGGGVGVLPEGRAPEILFIEDPKEIFEKIKSFCQPGDVILLESRVPDELIKQLTAF